MQVGKVRVPDFERVLRGLIEGSGAVKQSLRWAKRKLHHNRAVEGPGLAFEDIAKERFGSEYNERQIKALDFIIRREVARHARQNRNTSLPGRAADLIIGEDVGRR